MICFDPIDRLSLNEIENHRWFKTSFKNEEEARNKLVKDMDWNLCKYKLSQGASRKLLMNVLEKVVWESVIL